MAYVGPSGTSLCYTHNYKRMSRSKVTIYQVSFVATTFESNKPPNIGAKLEQSWEKAEWRIVWQNTVCTNFLDIISGASYHKSIKEIRQTLFAYLELNTKIEGFHICDLFF